MKKVRDENKTIEITGVYQTKDLGLFKTLLGGIDIIPDPSVNNGKKRTLGPRIFISPTNYSDIKGYKPEMIMTAIDLLEEI